MYKFSFCRLEEHKLLYVKLIINKNKQKNNKTDMIYNYFIER